MLEKVRVLRRDGVRIHEVVGRIGARLVDADAPVHDGEGARATLRSLVAQDHREVLVGELDHVRELREVDATSLAEERVVVAAVEIHPAPG
jgi:hypothetical protein